MAGELGILGITISNLISAGISILFTGVILHLATKILKIKKAKWGTAFTIAAMLAGVTFLFNIIAEFSAVGFYKFLGGIIGVVLLIWLIKEFYNLKLGKSIITALIVWVISFAIVLILVFLFVLLLIALAITI